ncbi:hypothetical protein [Kordia sp.]|uniref:hypothetical protein n=1 Tax=Kordia sp. TaxID=1965332 RepID=UPI003D26EEB3
MPNYLQKKENTKETVAASSHATKIQDNTTGFNFQDNRPNALVQLKLQKQLNGFTSHHFPSTVIQRQCDNPDCSNDKCTGNECNASKKPIPFDPRQTHLSKRALKKKGPPTMVVSEKFDGEHGVDSLNNGKLNTKKYREPQIQHKKGYGGTGIDETVSTATTRDYIDSLDTTERESATKKLSTARVETSKLMWPTGEPDRPISAHPGGLSKSQTDMRKGLTGLHGTKDVARAETVNTELNNTNVSKKEAQENAITRSELETTQHFMKPYGEMQQVDVSKAKESAYHPQFGQIINKDTGEKMQPNYNLAMLSMQKERERLKVKTSQKLIHSGKSSLVAPEMQEHLKGNYTPQRGPNYSLATPLDKDKTLDQIESSNKKLPESSRRRGVSPPRAIPTIYKSNDNQLSGKKRKRQTSIFDYFPPNKKIKLEEPTTDTD